jgi:hypothetical protein
MIGLRKIQKPDMPLKPTISCTDSPCYALARFVHNNLSSDVLVSFDIVNIFTNIPVDEASRDNEKLLKVD